MKQIGLKLIFLLAVIGGWQVVYYLKIFSPILLPSPIAVGAALIQAFVNPTMGKDLLFTAGRLAIGLSVGVSSGLALGLLMGSFRWVLLALGFWVDFFRSIPPPALLPPLVLFFGFGDLSKIILVIIMTGLVTAVSTFYGVKNANATRLMAASSLGLGKIDIFFKVLLPEALPAISSGVRLAISLALIVVVVSEMLSSAEFGLGKSIIDFQMIYETSQMYAAIIITGILGYLINRLYLVFETKKIHWAGK